MCKGRWRKQMCQRRETTWAAHRPHLDGEEEWHHFPTLAGLLWTLIGLCRGPLTAGLRLVVGCGRVDVPESPGCAHAFLFCLRLSGDGGGEAGFEDALGGMVGSVGAHFSISRNSKPSRVELDV